MWCVSTLSKLAHNRTVRGQIHVQLKTKKPQIKKNTHNLKHNPNFTEGSENWLSSLELVSKY